MDTRQVLLVDAFASEPLGGQPIAVLPDGSSLTVPQRAAIATEFGADGTVTPAEDGLRYVRRNERDGLVAGAVAGCVGLFERGHVGAGIHAMTVETDSDGDAGAVEYEIEVEQDRSVSLTLSPGAASEPEQTNERIAAALGIDVAAVDDVSADLPIATVGGYGGTLLVPVNFLEHLSRAAPAGEDLATQLAEAGATRLCAFTFDTLASETDLHARFFVPDGDRCERPTSGVAAAACGRHLSNHPVFDEDRESVRIECGRFLDRPATILTTLADEPTVGGRALTVLDGELTLPADDGDDLIVV
jgi:trans-2,3-dihydro-3-hydroxyanthranilate isomerase